MACKHVSSSRKHYKHDIVTAAMGQQSARNYQVCLHSVDFRKGKRWPNVGDRDAGNISRIIAMNLRTSNGAETTPTMVRRFTNAIPQLLYDNLPFWPLFSGRAYNQTNWASLQRVAEGTIFHGPFREVVASNDIPIMIVYQPTETVIGISYMLKGIDPTAGLLGELSVDSM